jgi:ComF family protein
MIELIDQTLFCEKCGQNSHNNAICELAEIYFDNIHSWGFYKGPLKSIVQKLKYNRGVGLVRYLLPYLCNFISSLFGSIDVIIPLPLGRKRELSRGYNQTALFAKPAAKELGVQYLPEAVERIRETISQVGLSARERETNIQDAFKSDMVKVEGMNILLMDDITTTGATINECAKSLKLAGAASVDCFTLAKARNLI